MADRLLRHGFRIGTHRVQPLTGLITGQHGTRHVQPKVMDVLVCLARQSGQLVERDAIIEQVWRRATSEEVLTRCISELRRALGDERGTPQYIQTVPKRGYRLLAPVVETESGDAAPSAGDAPPEPARDEADEADPPGFERPMHVLLVDDHPLFREGLKLQLLEHDESTVCLEAGSCEEAIALSGEPVDLVLLDYGLPGLRGLEAIARIRAAFAAPITIVSATEDPLTIREAIMNGAMGYIPKTTNKKELFAALGVVRAGAVYLPRQVLFGAPQPAPSPELSPRQRKVLRAALQGNGANLIAAKLSMPEQEVEALLFRAFCALGVNNRIEAVYELARSGTVLD